MNKRTIIGVGITALTLTLGLAACGSAPATSGSASQAPASASASTSAPADVSVAEETPTPEAPAAPAMTLAQEQAVQSAQSYLDMGGFSEAELLGQLTSKYGEGFSKADAQFAIKYLSPIDWNAQAVQSAQSYLDMGGFSRSELLDQLTSKYGEQFTKAQALHALKVVGY
jgi:hypothetical protein